MKKIISLLLMVSFSIAPIFNNCYAVNAEDASLSHLLNSEVFIEEKLSTYIPKDEVVYYEELKKEIMKEISERDLNDILFKIKDTSNEISKLENNLKLLKLNKETLYTSVENALLKIETSKKIQKILENEVYKRTPWSKYLLTKIKNVTGSTLKGGIIGSIAGSFVATVFSPFLGFNSKVILQYALSNSISYSINSAVEDISNKYGNTCSVILNLISTIASNVLTSKILP